VKIFNLVFTSIIVTLIGIEFLEFLLTPVRELVVGYCICSTFSHVMGLDKFFRFQPIFATILKFLDGLVYIGEFADVLKELEVVFSLDCISVAYKC
jgi:hypothetical protein